MNATDAANTRPGAGRAAGHAKSHAREYLAVFGVLALLTVAELLVPELPVGRLAKGTALVALAAAKAFLVGWFFMHLKDERAWLKGIACAPLAAALFAAAVILDSIHR